MIGSTMKLASSTRQHRQAIYSRKATATSFCSEWQSLPSRRSSSDLRAKLKAGVRHPLPTHAVQKFKPGDEPATEPQPPESDVRNHPRAYSTPASNTLKRVDRTVNRIDGGEQIGYGHAPPGGRSVIH